MRISDCAKDHDARMLGSQPFLTEYITGSLEDLPPSPSFSRCWSRAIRANSCIVKVLGMKMAPLETGGFQHENGSPRVRPIAGRVH